MSKEIHVHLLPALFKPEAVSGGIAVVVDILRASTTMAFALHNGAAGIVPCGSIDDALALREKLQEKSLLGGERGGVKIDGFDLSNSPDDYEPDTISGQTIGFTTTNGTKALLQCKLAERVFIGSFVNFSAVASLLQRCHAPIHIVCAGTNGEITGEDVLYAGALAQHLLRVQDEEPATDAGVLAVSHWRNECGKLEPEALERALRKAQGGRNLIGLGYDKDITTAARIDCLEVVGELFGDGTIRTCQQEILA